MTVIAVDRPPSAEERTHASRESRLWRARLLAVTTGLFVTALSGALLVVGMLTAFRTRRLYAAMARYGALAVLAMYGIRLRVHHSQPLPRSHTIYISNHTSTLDLFILVALGLPNCRVFLSGFLRNYVPLGIIAWMMGTFFTVPQDRSAERVRIFQRADRTLRRTGESVYLSPEGGRITGGRIGHFNKGAFHLATSLRVPIVPLFFRIPSDIDPGRGYDARPGTVDVYVLPTIDTSRWTLPDVATHASSTRELYVQAARAFSR
jgi:putative phosphoserine phosphatase/1-acylglycerol-3-phosphate O-acyltransferase